MTPIEALRQYWGFDAFRPLQEEIISSSMNGVDTLALLPTGGGKSLCYQVPALCLPGLALVISPLIALMNDQVANLKMKGIKAAAITSHLSKREWIDVLDSSEREDLKLLYLSPERLLHPLVLEKITAKKISLIAVDEAHCISQWGHDFRPAYRKIAQFRNALGIDIPCLALTATATPRVVDDIVRSLNFRNGYQVFKKSFHRPNLSYNIRLVENKVDALIEALRAVPGSAIVFMRQRLKTAEVAQVLKARGISADFYHAGLPAQLRKEKQQAWMDDKIRVMAATNAFGMGIDKPDVRLVVHLDIVPSLEEYFQEAGRAGRDEKKAYAVSFITAADLRKIEQLLQTGYPTIDEITTLYQKLHEFLRCAVGQGQWDKFPFSIQKFAQYVNLPKSKCYEILSWLEREGYIALDDEVLQQSKLKLYLDFRDFDKRYAAHSDMVDVVKAVLRLYEGVKHSSVDIEESRIAYAAERSEKLVRRVLYQLSRTGDADYHPKETDGYITLLTNRIEKKYFTINHKEYNERKRHYLDRLKAVKSFYQSTTECRVTMLLRYLGEHRPQPCGCCDFCRDARKARNNDLNPDLLRKASENEWIIRDNTGKILWKNSVNKS
ncbi:RecQ family ATP-dependent DNA helicase [Schleiferia thermophila]|nr:ATP-dependent DNA helicase RecQ [Schleiferia thermophila]